jgi:hypothetical protein
VINSTGLVSITALPNPWPYPDPSTDYNGGEIGSPYAVSNSQYFNFAKDTAGDLYGYCLKNFNGASVNGNNWECYYDCQRIGGTWAIGSTAIGYNTDPAFTIGTQPEEFMALPVAHPSGLVYRMVGRLYANAVQTSSPTGTQNKGTWVLQANTGEPYSGSVGTLYGWEDISYVTTVTSANIALPATWIYDFKASFTNGEGAATYYYPVVNTGDAYIQFGAGYYNAVNIFFDESGFPYFVVYLNGQGWYLYLYVSGAWVKTLITSTESVLYSANIGLQI